MRTIHLGRLTVMFAGRQPTSFETYPRLYRLVIGRVRIFWQRHPPAEVQDGH